MVATNGAAVATRDNAGAAVLVEQALIEGDLAKLSPAQRVQHYQAVCGSLGLNPLTKPFEYISLNGRLVLYARRDATDQLRKLHGIDVTIVSRERMEDVYIVTARATYGDGRKDESIGAVSIAGLKGEALANALMKSETKAKRRVTLSIVGLGWLDETEVESVRDARPVTVVQETGEIIDGDAPIATTTVPSRPRTSTTLEAAQAKYDQRCEEAVELFLKPRPRDPKWTYEDIVRNGQELAEMIRVERERQTVVPTQEI